MVLHSGIACVTAVNSFTFIYVSCLVLGGCLQVSWQLRLTMLDMYAYPLS